MRKFTLSIFLVLSSLYVIAAGPTVPASSLQFPAANLEGNRFTMIFNKGNGAFRIIVVKEGSAITSLPVNGTDYTANAAFGNPSSVFAAGDGYVVYKGSTASASFTQLVTNLQPGTTYFVSVFEFNGSGAATEYLNIPLSGNVTTKAAPAGQATITTFTAVAGNRLTINWSVGTGERRLVLARKGAPVNAEPQDLVDYAPSTSFGNGNVLNTDNFVVYKGQGASTPITNLEPNTTYHFAIFEYNGNNFPVYKKPGNANSRLTNAGPTQASGAISFSSIEGDRLTLTFPAGNGKHQLIIAREGQAPTFVPVNGQAYTASTVFQSGQQVAAGEYVLNTTNTDRTFSNLLPSTVYYFRIYDFDVDAAGNTYYLTSSFSQNSRSTAVAPTQQASNVTFENITGSSLTIKHDIGNSAYRLVVIKAGGPVDAIPQNLIHYNGNQAYMSGEQITPGNYVLTGGQNSTTLPITGLSPGVTYHVAVFGFNGNNYPVYALPAATASITMPNQPTSAGTGWQIQNPQGNAFRAQWTGGNGSKRIVIIKKGAPVTAVPVDGTTYTANPVFNQGYEIAPGEYVVYNDVNRVIDITNLEPGSVYHFAVFEYNGSGAATDYLVSSFLTATGTTISAPTAQANVLSASNIQTTQATINFSAGNGDGRMLIIRAGSPVNTEPQDLQSYNYSSTYGGTEIGSGNYIIQKTTGTAAFAVLGLSANTTYYVSAFEYNGTTAPMYKKQGASFCFTTAAAGIPAPSQNASLPSFSLIDGNKLNFNWDEGDGAKRIVVVRQGSAVTFIPANGNDYPANSSFGDGNDLGNGQYVVYNGVNNSISITHLLPSVTYHFAVFEYNGTGVTATYLTAGALTVSRSTAVSPASGSTNVSGAASGLTLNISWQTGPGDGRIVAIKEGSAITGLPADLSKYPTSAIYGGGSQIGTGEYIVYAGSGTSVLVTGLSANKTYYYTVFEYNGVDAPVYNKVNVVSNSTIMPVALPLTWLYFTGSKDGDKVNLKWGTADEVNTKNFIVERSQSNGTFAAIANLPAAGSGSNNYTYTDQTVPQGMIAYRIRQVDLDGRFTYSAQVFVRMNSGEKDIKLFPNPAQDQTRISLPVGMQKATVQLFSLDGRLVKTKNVVNGDVIALNDIPKGMYTAVINDGVNTSTVKLLVR